MAALYVEPDGPYANLEGVEVWDEARDARKYAGPHPVVAHPPCARWCQMAYIVQALHGYRVGDDGGSFKFALESVRKYGGVLEHPAKTYAWRAHSLPKPPGGGWIRTMFDVGWVCEVEQGNYGCRAPKPTWLYAVRCNLPDLQWGRSEATGKIGGFREDRGYIPKIRRSSLMKVRGREASETPEPFRDLLLSMARSIDA